MHRPSIPPRKLTVRCADCGADLVVEPDRHFLDCDHCHATSVVDLGGTATCFRLKAALDAEHLRGHMQRWLRKLDLKEAEEKLERVEELLIPFWTFRTANGGERSLLAVDRADLPIDQDAQKPAGQLEHFGHEEEVAAGDATIEPSVPLPAALARSGLAHLLGADAEQAQPAASLVYVPYARFRYEYRGATYHALVDAATGKVKADAWPRPFNHHLDRRLGVLLAAALAAYLGCAVILPGVLWPLLAYVGVSAALGWGLTRVMSSAERPS